MCLRVNHSAEKVVTPTILGTKTNYNITARDSIYLSNNKAK